MTLRRHFLRSLLANIAAGIFAPVVLLAETRKRHPAVSPFPSPIPEESPTEKLPLEKSETALLRVWKMSDGSDLEIQFRILPYNKPMQEAILPLKPGLELVMN